MSTGKLIDRVNAYEAAADIKLLPKVPLIISLNLRASSKITSLLDKPFCAKFSDCIYSTMIRLINEISGSVFAYSFNDEIIIVARNDQSNETEPWCQNKIQKIASLTAAIATLHFNNCVLASDLSLLGDAVFLSKVFVVPNITESVNVFVSKQQSAFQSSIHFACFYELLKLYNKDEIREMLIGTSLDEKINLLKQELSIDFNKYPMAFRRGVACYRSPKIMDGTLKHKLVLNRDLPIFTREHLFLSNIFNGGADIIRQDVL